MRYPTILLALFCVACGSYSANVPTIKPYKMDVQQGNVVTSKMMMQLRPGMSKSQVRFIMGTPLLMDSFHADQWDYFYQMRKGGKIIEQRRIVLKFDGDKLARVSGDVIPATGDSVAEPGAVQPRPAKPAKEKGLLDRLKFWGDDEETPKASAQPAQKQEQAAPVPAATPPEPEPVKKAAEPAEPVPADPVPAASTEPASPAPEPVPEQPAQPAAAEPAPSAPEPVKAEPEPVKAEPEPVKPEPAAEIRPVPPAESPAPASRKAPEPAPKEAEAPRASEKAPVKTPAPKPAAAEERRMTAPLPPDDLPPEDAPDFFEKMLEKIGF